MPRPQPAEVERRALALFEHLTDQPHNTRLRQRLLKNEPPEVAARVRALEASITRAAGALPTLIPGSADCDGVLPPPKRVGAFRLVERIGRGGMGDVWAGQRDDGLYEQKVAVKLIQRHALARAGAAFDDERRFLARLNHPNIARLIDGGVTEDGLPWLVIEYVEGAHIDAACMGRSDAERAKLFIKAADAVQYAHGQMVAHADLKPSNILVDGIGRVRLLDFGIAGLIGEGSRSPTGSGPLTREYASPQRISGAGPSVSDDVFALGKTMGLALHESDDTELAAIAAKASDPDEAKRYGSAAALIADLDRWRARLPVSAVPDRWRYRASKFVERHRSGVIATGVAMIALSATSLIATSNYVQAEHSRTRAEQRFNDVRHLSHFILFDLYDDLARRPGTVEKRAEIAQTAAQYLERLSATGDLPTDLRLETVRSYRRLADIEGMPGASNLGEPERALQALDKADALLTTLLKERPRDADALAERGWVIAGKWALAGEGKKSSGINGAARGAFTTALEIAPDNALAQLGLIVAQKNEGYDLIWTANKPADAIPLFRHALATIRGRQWPVALQRQAQILEISLLNRTGDATYYAGNIPGALGPYHEANALVDLAIRRDGETPLWVMAKGEMAFNISGTLGDMGGHGAEALAAANAGVVQLERLLGAGPDAAAEKWLLVLYGQQAIVLDQLGRAGEALTPSAKSVALREARLGRAPNNPQRKRDLGIGLMPHAELLGKTGARAEACGVAQRAVAVWHDIARHENLGAFDAKRNLPRSETLQKKFCIS